jgi:hypothetical protein
MLGGRCLERRSARCVQTRPEEQEERLEERLGRQTRLPAGRSGVDAVAARERQR